MMETESLSDLAASALPTLSALDISTGSPGLSRTLTASLSDSRPSQQRFRPSTPSQGASLFGDTARLGNLASSLTPSSSAARERETADPRQPAVGVDAYLRHQRDAIAQSVVARQHEDVARAVQDALERQLQRGWETEREWWMKDIVGKDYVGGASLRTDRALTDGLRGKGSVAESTRASSGPASMASPRLAISRFATAAPDIDAQIMEQHVQVVKALRVDKGKKDIAGIVAKLESLAQNMPPQQGYYYGIACQLLSCMLKQPSTSPIDRTVGSLDHLSKQFRNAMVQRVQQSADPENSIGNMITVIQKYVDLEFGSNATIWHIVYFALRSGDAVTAAHALQFARAGEIEMPAAAAIQALSRRQGSMASLLETRSIASSATSHDAQDVDLLYESVSTASTDNVYKLGSLALLSGRRVLPSVEGAIGFGTIEDYIFGCQWKVIHSADPMTAIAKLGEHIRSFEPSYFDGQDGGKWAYALSLLATQQFASALACLANAGTASCLLQAAHLGLCIVSADSAPCDVGGANSNENVVNDVIAAYSSYLRTSIANGSVSALLYLLEISDKNASHHEIATLVAQSYWTHGNLAGQLSSEGIRQDAVLDKYMPFKEASAVIADAAEQVRKTAKDRTSMQNALNLFMLSGRYSSVIHVLNQMMSPPEDVNPERTYWRQQSELLYATHLSKRSFVLDSLEKEGKRELAVTNRTLAALCLFFENLALKRVDKCSEILESLRLLPRSSDDIAGKIASTRDLDSLLQRFMPALLRGAMECLYLQYRDVKSQPVAQSPTTRARLTKIREEGRSLSTFAGLLGIDRDSRDVIARFEAHMT